MEYDQESCRNLQFSLLRLLRSTAVAPSYIRQLQETVHCDLLYNHRELREEINEELGPERISRLTDFVSTDSDELKAIKLVEKNEKKYRDRIWSRLSPIEKLQFRFLQFGSKM